MSDLNVSTTENLKGNTVSRSNALSEEDKVFLGNLIRSKRVELHEILALMVTYRREEVKFVNKVRMPRPAGVPLRIQKAFDRLETARCWMGKLLSLCDATGYTNDYKTADDIEPAKDTEAVVESKEVDGPSEENIVFKLEKLLLQGKHVEFVVELRSYIKDIESTFADLKKNLNTIEGISKLNFLGLALNLGECNFELGWELGDIRDQYAKK